MYDEELTGAGRSPNVNSTLVTLQQGTYGRAVEVLDWSYYDTMTINPALSEQHLFQLSTAGKTLDQTNFNGNGAMPQGQELSVKALKIQYVQSAGKAAADIDAFYQFLSTTTLQVKIEGKASQYTKTLMEIFGIPIAMHVNAGEFVASYGRYVGIDPLNKKILLAAQTNFDIIINTWQAIPAALANDRIRVILSGILKRAV